VSSAACAGVAAASIVLLWGAIPLIVALEQRLAAEFQWLGHAAFHVWTATTAGVLCAVAFRAVRSHRIPPGLLRAVVTAATVVAGVVAATNALEAIAAHPSLRAVHDLLNTVGAPAGWILLAMLVATVIVAVVGRPRAARL
jgi:hypothetical protein